MIQLATYTVNGNNPPAAGLPFVTLECIWAGNLAPTFLCEVTPQEMRAVREPAGVAESIEKPNDHGRGEHLSQLATG